MTDLPEYQQRVVDERKELTTKIDALQFFIAYKPAFDTLSDSEKVRMKMQLNSMILYATVLGWRIEAFK